MADKSLRRDLTCEDVYGGVVPVPVTVDLQKASDGDGASVWEPMPTFQTTKVLFVDMDDTVRKGYGTTGKWVNGPEDVEVFEQVPALLYLYKQRGYRILGISNQGGVALKYMSRAKMRASMAETIEQCKFNGEVTLERIFVCPHHPDAEDETLVECMCRKPAPGLVFAAEQHLRLLNYALVPSRSLFVGDRPEDARCAAAAGIPFIQAETWRNQPVSPTVLSRMRASGKLSVRDSHRGDDQC